MLVYFSSSCIKFCESLEIFFTFIDCLFRFARLGQSCCYGWCGVELMYVFACWWSKELLKLQLLTANHGKYVGVDSVFTFGRILFTTDKMTAVILFRFFFTMWDLFSFVSLPLYITREYVVMCSSFWIFWSILCFVYFFLNSINIDEIW